MIGIDASGKRHSLCACVPPQEVGSEVEGGSRKGASVSIGMGEAPCPNRRSGFVNLISPCGGYAFVLVGGPTVGLRRKGPESGLQMPVHEGPPASGRGVSPRPLFSFGRTPRTFRELVGRGICPGCGGDVVGDGYQIPLHCENLECPCDREADAPALVCGGGA